MRKTLCLLLFFVLGAVLVRPAFADGGESVYDRVMRTGTIRCGYVLYPPSLMRDPNTGKIYGIAPDIMQKIADGLSLKLEWTEEVGTVSMIQGLEAGRYDLVCNTGWSNMARMRYGAYSRPVYYVAISAVARDGDGRFDDNAAAINDPSITISSVDGTTYAVIAQTLFPEARVVSAPELTDLYQPLTDVATGKADIAFAEDYVIREFMKNNPGKVKRTGGKDPVQIFSTGFLFKGGEYRFNEMVDDAVGHLLNTGDVDRIISRYEVYPGAFLRVAKPYEVPK